VETALAAEALLSLAVSVTSFLPRGRNFHTLQRSQNVFVSSQVLENRTIHQGKIGHFCRETSPAFHWVPARSDRSSALSQS
jgi:hypothetical protein